MLQLDHLSIIAPSLQEGLDHVTAQLGITPPPGGKHPDMGTHNHLLRLGHQLYLEVIAIDPDAPVPHRPRWFGLSNQDAIRAAWQDNRRLGGWVARTTRIAQIAAHENLGEVLRLSRGDLTWLMTVPPDGSLPMAGVAPTLIDWGNRDPPNIQPDLGATLVEFSIEHPDPDFIRQLYERLQVANPPVIRRGAHLRYTAIIDTPQGRKVLT